MGGQNAVTAEVSRLQRRVVHAIVHARGPNLGQAVHVGAAQHQRYVGMGHETAQPVDDVGVAVLADLDLRDHVLDQLQVDLGHRDAAVAAAMRHRHRQIGLALLAEIDRPEIGLVGRGLLEGGLGRAVDVAAHHVHAEPGDLELLVAVAVELGQFGDRGNLLQQADVFEAALIDRQCRPLRIGDPADLVLDFPDESLDLLRGCFRLLVLDLDRSAAIVLVDEIEVERGIDHQHAGDQSQEQDDVFEEQSALHSITSSARASMMGGTTMPSALAVLRLITSS